MANNLEKSQKYLDLILELFKRGSLTARLDSESMQYDNTDAKTVKVLTVKTTGLGNYEKDTGYPQGAITAEWVPLELTVDRGAKFLLDRVDDDEILGLTIGKAAQVFTDYEMIPEIDSYRFSRYFEGAGKVIEEPAFKPFGNADSGTGGGLLYAIDAAATYMNNLDVPEAGRILYVNQDLELVLRNGLTRYWQNDFAINTRVDSYNGLQIVYVPSKRFKTMIELLPGENDRWGYTTPAEARDINFMLIYPKSVIQASKTARGKFISADENQKVDSHEFQFRIFHDAFVIEKLKDGVFCNVRKVV
jgi:hypothetical protein